MYYLSPLRYPGGKLKLAQYVKILLEQNKLLGGEYIEPYTGGGSVALSLLFEEYVSRIYINDIDTAIYSFWYSVLNETESFCRLINDTPLTIDQWVHQRDVYNDTESSLLQRGFSAFYLNRTNRSGIVSGGIIGGKDQSGLWRMDARYNKRELTKRIEKIAWYKNRINLYNMDALDLLSMLAPKVTNSAFIYLDPPYYVKGKSKLYANFYSTTDHQNVANFLSNLSHPYWMISYDNIQEINRLYHEFRHLIYALSYSLNARYSGSEIIYFCNELIIPDITNPIKIKGSNHSTK